ncbi:transcription initiation factor TFIID subunit 4 [Drosophila ficusphila]|uniref:transcription initiation factor TFIID subunit 4 n=1 Tax=Drosophila ficusphila TaxID=30025 RepID=UPI001C8AB629|nr:transcription initiation factor TFIID subunit 4 [Drosophila ficusphila]
MSAIPIEVPMQPYCGQLLIIKDLILPDAATQDSGKSNNLVKKKTRPSFFERSSILKKIVKQMNQINQANEIRLVDFEPLLDAFLSALETYMKFVVKKAIELCEHRSGYHLYNDDRCVMKNDMRATMVFLNNLEMADYGSSDEDSGFNRKRRAENDEKGKKCIRLETLNSTAMMALGSRKRPAEDAATPAGAAPSISTTAPPNPQVQRPFALRIKHLNIRDVLQFMEEDRRYHRSNMLFEAYLKYKA